MRFAQLAAALCLGAGIQLIAAAADDDPASHRTSAVEKAPVSAADEAAQRHIKRTVCLREAREKKLLGAAKAAYLRSCIAAP